MTRFRTLLRRARAGLALNRWRSVGAGHGEGNGAHAGRPDHRRPRFAFRFPNARDLAPVDSAPPSAGPGARPLRVALDAARPPGGTDHGAGPPPSTPRGGRQTSTPQRAVPAVASKAPGRAESTVEISSPRTKARQRAFASPHVRVKRSPRVRVTPAGAATRGVVFSAVDHGAKGP